MPSCNTRRMLGWHQRQRYADAYSYRPHRSHAAQASTYSTYPNEFRSHLSHPPPRPHRSQQLVLWVQTWDACSILGGDKLSRVRSVSYPTHNSSKTQVLTRKCLIFSLSLSSSFLCVCVCCVCVCLVLACLLVGCSQVVILLGRRHHSSNCALNRSTRTHTKKDESEDKRERRKHTHKQHCRIGVTASHLTVMSGEVSPS